MNVASSSSEDISGGDVSGEDGSGKDVSDEDASGEDALDEDASSEDALMEVLPVKMLAVWLALPLPESLSGVLVFRY